MKKVTAEQLTALRAAAACWDFEEARAIVKAAGIKPDTAFYTDEEKRIALRARAAMYNPADLGKYGKLNEIEKRVNASKSAMPWSSFKARTPNLADQTVKVNGTSYALEHKSGAGDWYKTRCATLESAMDEYTKRHKLLVWDTDEFTLVIPFGEFTKALDSYHGRGVSGWQTFFKAELAVSMDGTSNVVQLQTWTNSTPKKVFLKKLAKEYEEYFELVKDLIF